MLISVLHKDARGPLLWACTTAVNTHRGPERGEVRPFSPLLDGGSSHRPPRHPRVGVAASRNLDSHSLTGGHFLGMDVSGALLTGRSGLNNSRLLAHDFLICSGLGEAPTLGGIGWLAGGLAGWGVRGGPVRIPGVGRGSGPGASLPVFRAGLFTAQRWVPGG